MRYESERSLSSRKSPNGSLRTINSPVAFESEDSRTPRIDDRLLRQSMRSLRLRKRSKASPSVVPVVVMSQDRGNVTNLSELMNKITPVICFTIFESVTKGRWYLYSASSSAKGLSVQGLLPRIALSESVESMKHIWPQLQHIWIDQRIS